MFWGLRAQITARMFRAYQPFRSERIPCLLLKSHGSDQFFLRPLNRVPKQFADSFIQESNLRKVRPQMARQNNQKINTNPEPEFFSFHLGPLLFCSRLIQTDDSV